MGVTGGGGSGERGNRTQELLTQMLNLPTAEHAKQADGR